MSLASLLPLFVPLLCLALAAACTLRSLRISSQVQHGLYKDNDGVATKESENKAAKVPLLASVVVSIAPAIGLARSIHGAAWLGSTPQCRKPTWLTPLLWALLALQANLVSRQNGIRQRYSQAITAAGTAATIWGYHAYTWAALSCRLPLTGFLCSLVTIAAFLSFPRRPVVFYKGNKVLHENGVSVLEWLVFSWGLHPNHGRLPATLAFSDLPRIAYNQSAAGIRARFDERDRTAPLWGQLAGVCVGPLILQWILVFLEAVSEFGVRFAMHNLLQRLELVSSSSRDTWAWAWVAMIALGQLGETTCDNWNGWIGHSKLQMPLLALIRTLIFEKMMRMPAQGAPSGDDGSSNESSGPDPIDLVLDHSNTVAMAYLDAYEFPLSIFKICINAVYLSSLLGFGTLLLGAIVPVLAVLLSRKLTARYQTLQTNQSRASEKTFSLISEALHGLRQIRLSSMERFWEGRLSEARNCQQDLMWLASLQLEMLNLVANLGPILFASATISLFAYRTGRLSPAVAFTALNLFGNLQYDIRRLPHRYAALFRANSSFQKVKSYLQSPEQARNSIRSDNISLTSASLAWPGHGNERALDNINLSFPKAEVSLVVGKVGSGKSLLLSAILDEALVLSGHVKRPQKVASTLAKTMSIVPGSTAYVSQPPWIEDVTVKDNIVFGYDLDEVRYQKVLDACALRYDLSTLSDSDRTTAGTLGSTLSGGQKWRVALARAIYSPAETILLEDILGAVDAPIARYLCENTLQGELVRGRTIILATHHPDYLASSGYLVSVENGTATGTTNPTANAAAALENVRQQGSEVMDDTKSEREDAQPQPSKAKSQPVNAQDYWRILRVYIQTGQGLRGYLIGTLITISYRMLSAGHSWWLAKWSSGHEIAQRSTTSNIAIYLSISVASSIALTAQTLYFTNIGHASSKLLFGRLVKSVLRAPLSWIDGSSPGQVVQTLGSDMYAINHRMAPQIIGIVSSVTQIVFICSAGLTSSPYMVAAMAILLYVYVRIALQSLEVASKLRPLNNSHLFPMSDYAQSARTGLMTIRAFGRAQSYIEGMQDLIDIVTTSVSHLALGLSWLGIRLGLVGAVFVTSVASAMVYGGSDAASTGFAITLALQLRQALSITIGQLNVVRTGFNAVDRVLAVADIPSEAGDGAEPDAQWPATGAITVQELTVRHGPSLPMALKDVSFELKPGQRLGIVGRTGAGKTTLMSAMLRFIEAASGRIVIDGVDISQLSIQRIRSAIAIIPQDPFLFSGTLRSNVDLYARHTDGELLSVLRRVHFLSDMGEKDTGSVDLDMDIRSGGTNLSHGQRQLVCLARVMLEPRRRILILDEATSGIDGQTEAAIQQAIRHNFADTTILVVAHKLLTVADFDSLLVLSQGEVVESGRPAELLRLEGIYADMVERSGDAEKIRRVINQQ